MLRKDNLNKYVLNPQWYSNEVVYFDHHVVIAKDSRPKAKAHYLVMPRDPRISNLHPYQALSDESVVKMLEPYVQRARIYAANQLRILKHCKGKEQVRKLAQLSFPDNGSSCDELDLNYIWAGCHAIPSMAALHVHVISSDFVGDALENVHRYLVFTTPFFTRFGVPPEHSFMNDELRAIMYKASYDDVPICVHCGKVMKSDIKEIKAHLDIEFQAWLNQ